MKTFQTKSRTPAGTVKNGNKQIHKPSKFKKSLKILRWLKKVTFSNFNKVMYFYLNPALFKN